MTETLLLIPKALQAYDRITPGRILNIVHGNSYQLPLQFC